MVYKMDENYLFHHGIKGQKWGEQNGPPYPLNPQKDYSKAEQKANAKALMKDYRKNGGPKNYSENIRRLSDNSIIKDNVHDIIQYRKTKIDPLVIKYAKQFENGNTSGKLTKEIWQAYNEYEKLATKVTNNILGSYGDKPIKTYKINFKIEEPSDIFYFGSLQRTNWNQNLNDVVKEAIEIASDSSDFTDLLDQLVLIDY